MINEPFQKYHEASASKNVKEDFIKDNDFVTDQWQLDNDNYKRGSQTLTSTYLWRISV